MWAICIFFNNRATSDIWRYSAQTVYDWQSAGNKRDFNRAIAGHIVFGLIVGSVSLGIRYMIIAGLFPIALDADHLVHFLNIDSIPRMGHSFAFALVSFPIMMYLLDKKDYRLGAISIAAVLTHVSFDILLSEPSGTRFPILIPFSNKMITLIGLDWVVFLASAVIVVACGTLLHKRSQQSTNLTAQNHN